MVLILRRCACTVLFAFSVSISGWAAAQTPDDPPELPGGEVLPPEYQPPIVSGVDMSKVHYTIASPAIAIGSGAPGSLVYQQVFIDDDWRHNIMGGIDEIAANTVYVTTPAGGEVFEYSGGSWSPEDPTGTTLTFNSSSGEYTYTMRNGAVAVFEVHGQESGVDVNPLYGSDVADIVSLTAPNGARMDYHYVRETITLYLGEHPITEEPIYADYSADRLQSVTSNTGYQMHFAYDAATASTVSEFEDWMDVDRVTLINNAIDYCSPTTNTCPTFTEDWPYLEISFPASNQREYTDALGRDTVFRFNGAGQINGVNYPGGITWDVVIAYSSGLVTSITELGQATYYNESDSGGIRTVTVSTAAAGAVDYETEIATGLVVATENADNYRVEYDYDAYDRIQWVTTPDGNSTEYQYDARSNVEEIWRWPNDPYPGDDTVPAPTLMMEADYPSSCSNLRTCNQPDSVTNADQQTTEFRYSGIHGGVTRVTLPEPTTGADQPETRIYYDEYFAYYKDASGSIAQALSGVYLPDQVRSCRLEEFSTCNATTNQIRRVLNYGSTGVANNLDLSRIRERDGTNGNNANTVFSYDHVGNVVTVDPHLDGTDNATHYRFDVLRRLVGEIGPDPDDAGPLDFPAQRITYNTDGSVDETEWGTVTGLTDTNWAAFTTLQSRETDYDSYGRPTHTRLLSAAGAAQALIQVGYNSYGQVECVAQRMNPSEFATPPSSACAHDTQGSYGPDRIRAYGYDGSGRVDEISIYVPNGGGGFSAEAEMTRSFNARGQIAWIEDGEGNRTGYDYDDLFYRMIERNYPNPSMENTIDGNNDEVYTYSASGNVLSYTSRSGQTFNYTYDNLGRVTDIDAPGSHPDTSLTYDNHGRILTITEGSETITNTYHPRGWLASQQTSLGTVSYQYDALGRRTRLTWPDSFYVEYDYRVSGQLKEIRENGATSGAGLLAVFAYDALGRRTSLTRGNGVVTSYDFDAAGRLSELAVDMYGSADDLDIDFEYNPASQIVERGPIPNTFVWDEHTNFTHDMVYDGLNQLTSWTGVSGIDYDTRGNLIEFGSREFVYDAYNRLTQIDVSSSTVMALGYDPLGRLSSETVGSTTLDFLYDGAFLIAEYNSSAAVTNRYVHGPGVDEVIVEYAGSGTSNRTWLVQDERNSVIARTDGTGAVTGRNTYDEHGQPGAGNAGRFGYTGQIWLEDAELYHYRARAYDPSLGRFLQSDPIGFAGGMNLYGYVGGDPVNMVDPTGLDGEPVCDPIYGCQESTVRVRGPQIEPMCEGYCMTFSLMDGWALVFTEWKFFDQYKNLLSGSGGGGGREGGRPHRYRIQIVTQCSSQTTFNLLRAEGNSAPGAPYAETGTHDLVLSGDNPISQTVDPQEMRITNVTLPGHIFYPGTVDIRVLGQGPNYSVIDITGTGQGRFPTLNNILGGLIFGKTAIDISQYCRARAGGRNVGER